MRGEAGGEVEKASAFACENCEPGPWTGIPVLPAAYIFSVSSSTSSDAQVSIGACKNLLLVFLEYIRGIISNESTTTNDEGGHSEDDN